MQPKYAKILPDRDRYRRFYLDEDVTLTLANGDIKIIPKGYRFDGQSVPYLFRLFQPTFDRDIYAAMVHDYLIDMESLWRYNRKFQDDEYTRFMNKPEYFASRFRRYVFPKVVRLYGFLAFDIFGDNRGVV